MSPCSWFPSLAMKDFSQDSLPGCATLCQTNQTRETCAAPSMATALP